MQTLDALVVGGRAQVVSVEATEPIRGRLLDLGFVPGTEVRLRSRAPLGDPAVYELRGSRMCLRRGEAQQIWVQRLDG